MSTNTEEDGGEGRYLTSGLIIIYRWLRISDRQPLAWHFRLRLVYECSKASSVTARCSFRLLQASRVVAAAQAETSCGCTHTHARWWTAEENRSNQTLPAESNSAIGSFVAHQGGEYRCQYRGTSPRWTLSLGSQCGTRQRLFVARMPGAVQQQQHDAALPRKASVSSGLPPDLTLHASHSLGQAPPLPAPRLLQSRHDRAYIISSVSQC